jgi:hypothetical protein
MKRITSIILVLTILCAMFALSSCEYEDNGRKKDVNNTLNSGATLQSNQPTPTDLDYSLERYNLIRRAYWVNGQREKANALPCAVEKPLGYVVLFSGNVVIGNFVVDGKVSSLNSYLTPDSMYYEVAGDYIDGESYWENEWLPDVDGSYGTNDNGIFFFTPDGKYIEWTGTYLYSDIPFEVDSPILNIGGAN